MMSPWLFNIYVYGVTRGTKAKLEKGVQKQCDSEVWCLVTGLCADDTVLFA